VFIGQAGHLHLRQLGVRGDYHNRVIAPERHAVIAIVVAVGSNKRLGLRQCRTIQKYAIFRWTTPPTLTSQVDSELQPVAVKTRIRSICAGFFVQWSKPENSDMV
jgi:hypothetical protein